MKIHKLLFEFFYPRICAACNNKLLKDEESVCLKCLSTLPKTNFHTDTENPVFKTFWGRIPLEKATSYYYFTKHSKVQSLLHNIKYKGCFKAAEIVGLHFGNEMKEAGFYSDTDMVVPVPLHPKKQLKRGYNQSEHFAKGIADGLEKMLNSDNLIRIKYSDTQTKKARYERWENVGGIFSVKDPGIFENKHVLLIDDVITTGSTIEACYQALKNISGLKLSLASIAIPAR